MYRYSETGRTIVAGVKIGVWRINCRAKGAAGQRESAILSYLIHCVFFFSLHNRDFALTAKLAYDSAVTHPARYNKQPSREGDSLHALCTRSKWRDRASTTLPHRLIVIVTASINVTVLTGRASGLSTSKIRKFSTLDFFQ